MEKKPPHHPTTHRRQDRRHLGHIRTLTVEETVIRPMMYLAVSYDHRVVDGRQAVTFLKRIVSCLEDPERLLLEI